jgi:hypothetical protein
MPKGAPRGRSVPLRKGSASSEMRRASKESSDWDRVPAEMPSGWDARDGKMLLTSDKLRQLRPPGDFERVLPEFLIDDAVWRGTYDLARRARTAGVSVPPRISSSRQAPDIMGQSLSTPIRIWRNCQN